MASFRLTVCRPVSLERPLIHLSSIDNSFRFTFEDSYEQIFEWAPEVAIWDGIADEALRVRLKEAFTQWFGDSLPLKDRSIAHLSDFIDTLKQAVDQEETAVWMPSQQAVRDEAGEEYTLSLIPHLALLNHLIWLYETLRDVPGLVLMER